MRGSLLLASLVVALGACGDASPGDEPPLDGAMPDRYLDEELECDGGACSVRRCRELTYHEGPAEEGLVVGEWKDGAFVPWADGGDATYVFGFQGGVMVQPVVEVPETLVDGDPCALVTLRHRPDPAHPAAAGEVESFPENVFVDPLRTAATGWRSESLDDQIGWAAADGVRMIVEAEVRTTAGALRTELHVRLVDEDGWDECDVLPRVPSFGGCVATEVPGDTVVDAVGDLTDLSCADTVPVTVTLQPSIEVPEGCFELTQPLDVPRGCVEAQGITAGAVLEDAGWRVDESGLDGCPPSFFGVSTEGCGCP